MIRRCKTVQYLSETIGELLSENIRLRATLQRVLDQSAPTSGGYMVGPVLYSKIQKELTK